jgi:hypothetical protein
MFSRLITVGLEKAAVRHPKQALAVMDWAINFAGIPPSRILVFSQSMGTNSRQH